MRDARGVLALACVWLLPALARADDHSATAGFSLGTLLAIAAFAVLPLLLIAATSFAKLTIVFSLLRNALGAQDVPSGAVVTALAAILSAYVMTPVAAQMAATSAPATARIDVADPFAGQSRGAVLDALRLAIPPLAGFLQRNAGAAERTLFVDLARRARPKEPASSVRGDELAVVLPAFLITELKEAFQIGLLVLLPFVIIDLVVASLLMSLGMTALPPAAVALPFKLLLFVLVDGWYVLSQALVSGYR
jgi:type III secretion protein R